MTYDIKNFPTATEKFNICENKKEKVKMLIESAIGILGPVSIDIKY